MGEIARNRLDVGDSGFHKVHDRDIGDRVSLRVDVSGRDRALSVTPDFDGLGSGAVQMNSNPPCSEIIDS